MHAWRWNFIDADYLQIVELLIRTKLSLSYLLTDSAIITILLLTKVEVASGGGLFNLPRHETTR